METMTAALTRLYAAAAGDEPWQGVLDAMLAAHGYDGAALYAFDAGVGPLPRITALSRGVWHKLDGAVQGDYETRYFRLDPRFHYGNAHPEARILHDRLHTAEAEMDRDPYYAWYLRNQPTRYYLGWRARRGLPFIGSITLHRRAARGPAEPAEIERLTALAPHLERALLVEWRLRRAAVADALGPMGDANPVGIVLLDRSGRVLEANAAARRMAGRADAFALGQAGLSVLRPGGAEARALAALIADALAPQLQPRGPAMVRLMRRWGGPDYLLSAIPLPRGSATRLFAEWAPAAAVTISDPGEGPAVPEAALRRAFGLTPAEARVAARLAAGDTVTEAAAALGLALATARSYLAAIFRKTGTARQAELVRLLMRLPPGLDAGG
jgi:DNA-binding CsgD family transcriptional regulator/PAS domain-containing protein